MLDSQLPSFLISSDFDFSGVTQKGDVSFNDGIYEMTIVDKLKYLGIRNYFWFGLIQMLKEFLIYLLKV